MRTGAAVSVRWLVPMLLVGPVVATAGVLGWLGVRQGRQAGEDLASRVMAEINQRIEDRLGAFLGLASRICALNEHLLNIGTLDATNLRSWLPTMREQIQTFDELAGVTYGSEAGEAVWIARYPGQATAEFALRDATTGMRMWQYDLAANGSVPATPRADFDTYDPRQRPWYRAAAKSAGGAWSPVYSWAREDGSGATIGVSFGRPLRDGQRQLRGVLEVGIELVGLSKFLGTLPIGQTGFAYIVERDGSLVASSTSAALTDVQGNRLSAMSSPDDRIRASARAVLARSGSFEEVASSERLVFGQSHARHRLQFGPLRSVQGVDWVVCVAVPEADVLAGVRAAAARSALIGGGVCAATIALGLVLGRAIARPVVALRDHAQRIGSGDLDATIDLRGTRELSQLSEQLNAMARDLKDRLRLRSALELAMEVQRSLLPAQGPSVPGLDIAGSSTYCDETGGDYFDFLDVAPVRGGVVVAVGDVMGHGIGAALLMATGRALLRSRASMPGRLGDVLAHVNTLLERDTGGTKFMTMLLMIVDRQAGTARFSSAGHGSPVVLRAGSDAFDPDESEGLPLGVVDAADYDDVTITGLREGDLLFIGSDGIWEAHASDGSLFGKERMLDLLRLHRGKPAREVLAHIESALASFCAPDKPQDDVTMLLVRFTATDPSGATASTPG